MLRARVTPEVYEKITALAEARDVPKAVIVREALTLYAHTHDLDDRLNPADKPGRPTP